MNVQARPSVMGIVSGSTMHDASAAFCCANPAHCVEAPLYIAITALVNFKFELSRILLWSLTKLGQVLRQHSSLAEEGYAAMPSPDPA